jgi:transposase-like protein/IS1 family transposase
LAEKGQVNCRCCNGETKKFGKFRNANRAVQRYRCLRCGTTFSESQPLDGLRLENEKVIQICKLLVEGLGIRATARFVNCDPHTVLNVLETVGQKCEAFLDRTLLYLNIESLQIDEIWGKAGKRDKNVAQSGGVFTYLGIDAKTKLIVSHYTGRRDIVSADFFVDDLAKRIFGRTQITTDGWLGYPAALRQHLADRIDYAVLHKDYYPDFYNPKEPARRFPTPVCCGIKIKIRAGNPRRELISTSYIERANLSIRHFTKRFARLGLGWSRKLENHCHAISLFIAAHNFCKVHSTLGTTPAVAARLASEVWTVEQLIQEATK